MGRAVGDLLRVEAVFLRQRPQREGSVVLVPVTITGPIECVDAVRRGIAIGLRVSGIKRHFVALGSAISIALDNEDACQRWLSGDDLFEPARLEDEEPGYDFDLRRFRAERTR